MIVCNCMDRHELAPPIIFFLTQIREIIFIFNLIILVKFIDMIGHEEVEYKTFYVKCTINIILNMIIHIIVFINLTNFTLELVLRVRIKIRVIITLKCINCIQN